MAAASAFTIIGMIEAVTFAKRSQAGSSIVAKRTPGSAAPSGFSLAPTVDQSGRAGFLLSARF
jgi:hypothetical protein